MQSTAFSIYLVYKVRATCPPAQVAVATYVILLPREIPSEPLAHLN